jgi:hypothetical protein
MKPSGSLVVLILSGVSLPMPFGANEDEEEAEEEEGRIDTFSDTDNEIASALVRSTAGDCVDV